MGTLHKITSKIPNGLKIFQMTIKYTKNYIPRPSQIYPNSDFSVLKCTIRQPCCIMYFSTSSNHFHAYIPTYVPETNSTFINRSFQKSWVSSIILIKRNIKMPLCAGKFHLFLCVYLSKINAKNAWLWAG
jgi:hypothetical protein